jgi:transcriptional regulator with XRE-family HTH domain
MRKARENRQVTETVAAPQSEGQRRLRAVVEADGYPAVATKLGANKGTVHRWVNGERQPSAEVRQRLEDVLGIPLASWGQSAGVAPARPVQAAQDIVRASRGADDDAFEALLAEIGDIDTSKLLATDAAKIIKLRWDMLADAEKRRRTREDQLAGHPSFARVVEALVRALKPYPDALVAARDALSEALG